MTELPGDERLRNHLEAIERLESEKAGVAEDIKGRYALLKSEGYDAAIMRRVVRIRKMEPAKRREAELILQTYCNSLGIEMQGTLF